MKKISTKNWIIVVLVILFGISVFVGCEKEKDYKKLEIQLEEATRIKDSLGKVIYVKDAEIVENQESMQDLRARLFETEEKYNKKVKEVKALIAQKTKVELVDVLVPYKDTTGMKKWEDSVKNKCANVIKFYEDSSVLVGTNAEDSTKDYNISLTILKEGIKIDSIKFIDSQYVSLTEFRGGFFKRNTKGKLKFYEPRRVKVEIKHTNPYFTNAGVNAFFYEEKSKNGYMAGLLHGTIVGSIINLLIFKP
jgi:hypothetical protein